MGTHILWALEIHILRPWELLFLGFWELICFGLLGALGAHFLFGLWAGRGPMGGPRGPKDTCNTIRLVGGKLLSHIIAAVVIFLAAVVAGGRGCRG